MKRTGEFGGTFALVISPTKHEVRLGTHRSLTRCSVHVLHGAVCMRSLVVVWCLGGVDIFRVWFSCEQQKISGSRVVGGEGVPEGNDAALPFVGLLRIYLSVDSEVLSRAGMWCRIDAQECCVKKRASERPAARDFREEQSLSRDAFLHLRTTGLSVRCWHFSEGPDFADDRLRPRGLRLKMSGIDSLFSFPDVSDRCVKSTAALLIGMILSNVWISLCFVAPSKWFIESELIKSQVLGHYLTTILAVPNAARRTSPRRGLSATSPIIPMSAFAIPLSWGRVSLLRIFCHVVPPTRANSPHMIQTQAEQGGKFFAIDENCWGLAIIVDTNRQMPVDSVRPDRVSLRRKNVYVVANNGTRSYSDLMANADRCTWCVDFDHEEDFVGLQEVPGAKTAGRDGAVKGRDTREIGRWDEDRGWGGLRW